MRNAEAARTSKTEGLTLEQLAGKLSTGAAAVHKIELGKSWVRAPMLERLATALDVPIYALFESYREGVVPDTSDETGDAKVTNGTPTSRGEVTNELLFETLKAIQGKLAEFSDDLREIKGRLGILEAQYASLSNRIDRIDERLARVERRLDLIEA